MVGRFTQEDLYRGDGLNLYAYCHNNPVMYFDPSGYAYQEENYNTIVNMNYDERVEALYTRRDEYFQTKMDNGKLKISNSPLLPGEMDAVLYNVKQVPGDNITPHHMPSAESIGINEGMSKRYGACSNVMEETHTNTFTYGMNKETRPYDSGLYESLSYDDRLNFDHYDLVDNYAKTRSNVDINVVESRLQEQYVLAKQAKELEEMKKEKC